jgi:hypothetical protein
VQIYLTYKEHILDMEAKKHHLDQGDDSLNLRQERIKEKERRSGM